METLEVKQPTPFRPERLGSDFYKIGFFLLLGVSLVLGIAFIVLTMAITKSSKPTTSMTDVTDVTLTSTPIPTRTQEPSSYVITLSTSSPTPTSVQTSFRSTLCPVEFFVKPGRIYIKSKNQYGLWQLKERKGERFMFLPRAEEVNGQETEIELRAENQIYYNGEGSVAVGCQDNPNKWGQKDFIDNAVKADFIDSYQLSTVKFWGRDVTQMLYTMKGNTTNSQTVWLFATPNKLFRVEKNFYNPEFTQDTEDVFQNLNFL